MIEADLHEIYGVDLGDRALLRARSWRWLRVRILALLSAESRLARVLTPPPAAPAPPGGTTVRR
ncbi:hypothetical protein MOV08_35185 [Streptomyces yunnanensis]|uniref:Uncharacterized protein n=1 Tax=Streptomyces yunnanensis TaxID=156453 RepID=A0ABY8AH92_9ACTN|nr:hypothetical protein [Streptomyces yunnanensis]WEB44011.1 hypothetical protein MOV08_35185 [Streptomyces yunnanensis]